VGVCGYVVVSFLEKFFIGGYFLCKDSYIRPFGGVFVEFG